MVKKNLPAMQEMLVSSLGGEDPLEKEMATHSSIFAWRIPWQRSLLGYGPWDRKESDMTERLFHFIFSSVCIVHLKITSFHSPSNTLHT